jgi:hypothetical protein
VRIAFIQKDPLPDPVVTGSAAALGTLGHEVVAFVPGAERDLARALRGFAPTLIVLAPHCGFEAWSQQAGVKLREITGGTPVAFIGPHASDHPKLVAHRGVDVLLRGDPELLLPALVDAVGDDREPGTAPGAVVATTRGELLDGPEPQRLEDPDLLPAEDLAVYRRYPWILGLKTVRFAVGRGGLENLHADSGISPQELGRRFGRAKRHSVDEAIQRLNLHLRRQPAARRVTFLDETLLARGGPKGWLDAFLERYRREIGLPFSCLARPDLLDGRIEALAQAGCDLVRLCIECGDEELRARTARTHLTDKAIRTTCQQLDRFGIRFHTVCIVGLPGETAEQALQSLDFCLELGPTHAFAVPYLDATPPADPALGRIRRLLPLVVDVPKLRELVPGALSRTMDGMLGTLYQLHYDATSLRFGDLSPKETLLIAARMRAGRPL